MELYPTLFLRSCRLGERPLFDTTLPVPPCHLKGRFVSLKFGLGKGEFDTGSIHMGRSISIVRLHHFRNSRVQILDKSIVLLLSGVRNERIQIDPIDLHSTEQHQRIIILWKSAHKVVKDVLETVTLDIDLHSFPPIHIEPTYHYYSI